MTWYDGNGQMSKNQGGPQRSQEPSESFGPSNAIVGQPTTADASQVSQSFVKAEPEDSNEPDMSIGGQILRMARGQPEPVQKSQPAPEVPIQELEPMVKSGYSITTCNTSGTVRPSRCVYMPPDAVQYFGMPISSRQLMRS